MADYQNNIEETDWNEFQEEQRDRQEEVWDEMDNMGGQYPQSQKSESLFSLFKDVWKTRDSTKVANLNPKTELGDLGLSVRQCQKIAFAAKILNEEQVNKYFSQLGEITLATSMSKNGWFPELFVSTKKFAHKSNNAANFDSANKKSGWRLFQGKKETATEEQ
jgi:uncharacterized protein (DUF2342 family)